MLHRRFYVAFLLCTFLVCTRAFAQAGTDQLAEVDRLRAEGQFQEALTRLEQMQAPRDPEVRWRLARTRVDLGEQARSADEQARLYRAAAADARAAVELAPRNADAHLALAIAAGREALISGTRQKIELSRTVKEAVDRAIELDPANATAYHVRARWNDEVASLGFFERAIVKVVYGGLPEASYEQAIRDFQQAVQLKDEVIHHLEMGKTYLKMGEKAKARAQFERALEMPDVDPDDQAYKAEAWQLLDETK